MAIRLPSHLHRAQSGILHFRIAIPPDLQKHFKIREIYRSLRTASVREATPTALALSQAAKRAFHQLRIETMSNQKKTPQDPFDGSDWGFTMEVRIDTTTPTKRTIKFQSEPPDTPEIVAAALAPFNGTPAAPAPALKESSPSAL
jgi:hypothetical protein